MGIIVESELREKRRKASISRRKELQSENLQRRIKSRGTNSNTSTFGQRRLSRATSNETSIRFRRPSVSVRDTTLDPISNNDNSNSDNSNNYNLHHGLENSGGDSDYSSGSDHEINASLALSRRNSILNSTPTDTSMTITHDNNNDNNNNNNNNNNNDIMGNSQTVLRRSTKLFDMEVTAEVAAVNLKVEQTRRREKEANRMKARLKEKYDSFAMQELLASSSDDDTASNLPNNMNNNNGNNTNNNTDDRHETMVVRKIPKKKGRKKS